VDRHLRIVVLCWNNRQLLPRCLDTALASRWHHGRLEVMVVDNGSTDGSVDDWEARYPQVRLVRNGRNLGFAGGVNAGLVDLEDLWAVALLNSDAFPEAGWLEHLGAALLADDAVGAAAPKILFAERDAGGRAVVNNAGNEVGPTWELHDRGYGQPDDGRFDREEDVWGWCGAAVLLRRSYLDDVGRFDDRLFMYAEDADLSWRGARRGWRYRFVPRAVVHHLHRGSSGGRRTPLLDYLNRRNRLVVVSRHAGARGATVAWVRAVGGIADAALREVVLPVLRGRGSDTAPVRRRVRAAWDAGRLLAGADPPLPTL
jgi:N-acetylglucosaminyl-diphospho-decaprenol L-rhamnosyltransferase